MWKHCKTYNFSTNIHVIIQLEVYHTNDNTEISHLKQHSVDQNKIENLDEGGHLYQYNYHLHSKLLCYFFYTSNQEYFEDYENQQLMKIELFHLLRI